MARPTSELLEKFERFVPPGYAALRPLLAGLAAQLHEVEVAGDDLSDAATVGGAEGIWLTLTAQGYGIRRAHGETDPEVRERVRSPELQLTRQAILDAVNELLATYTATEAIIIEHFDAELFLDVDLWLDQSAFYDQHNSFTLECPLVGDYPYGASFLGQPSAYLDEDLFLGDGVEHPIYAVIAAHVERLRAAGVRWWLVIDP